MVNATDAVLRTAMRLADFIQLNMKTILGEWDVFAAELFPAVSRLSSVALRDHGEDILNAIVTDLRTFQSSAQQDLKSRGRAVVLALAPETAAQTHAILRARYGFNINQLAAEYRALRGSVLRLWALDGALGQADVEDMMRFNEAVDQALAESIALFSRQVEEARDLTLGMFGHDLRNPLAAIRMSAVLLRKYDRSPRFVAIADVVESGCRQMGRLLEDLVDFNRVRLGLGLQINRTPSDLLPLCAEEVRIVQAAYPERRIDMQASGDCSGDWDGDRVQQLLGNLLANALIHGADDAPVAVELAGSPTQIVLSVRNRGEAIAPLDLLQIFEPLKRAGTDIRRDPSGSLGLGLYISQQIATAHGGNITVTSADGETAFRVALPRDPAVTPAAR